jgi:hypothetical protein
MNKIEFGLQKVTQKLLCREPNNWCETNRELNGLKKITSYREAD